MRYNLFQKVCVLFLIGAMLISVLPAQAIAASVSAQAAGESSQGSQTQEPENTDAVADDLTTGQRYYLDNGLVLELNEDGKTFTVVDFMNVQASSLRIPDSYLGMNITRIGDLAFKGKTALREVTLSDNILHIGDDVFSGCANLQWLEENGVRYIGSATNPYFYLLSAANQSITECTVSEQTKIVASYAFYNCKQLTEIVIPDGVIQVGFRALRGCDSLQSVTLPFAGETENGAENTHVGFVFGARTYGGNISFVPTTITSLVIKRGTLQKNALYGLDSVQHLGLPSMQQPLGYYFGGETYEDNIDYIPSALTSVEVVGGTLAEYGFYEAVNLKNILLGDDVIITGTAANLLYNTYYYVNTVSVDRVVYCGNHLLFARTSVSGKYTVREGTVSIEQEAFKKCTQLTGITIPDSVTRIGDSAFYGCSNLTSAAIPAGVSSISNSVFYNCSRLSSVTIPNSVSSIGNSVFYNCSKLTSVTIPDSVTSIGEEAFQNCSGLVSITIPEGVTRIGDATFSGCSSLASVAIPEGVTSIGIAAFSGCSKLTGITIPDGVTSIGGGAFYNCSRLTSITIPDGVTGIGDSTFYGCALTQITIGQGVTSIGKSAFYNCSRLTSITIPDSVTSIGDSAFYKCTKLSSLTIPDSVTSIGYDLCYGCTGLTQVVIGNGVTGIPSEAFRGCTGLTDITIGSSVSSIGTYAFYSCALTSITYNGTYAQWKSVSLQSDWNKYTKSYTIYCTDATVTKSGTVTYLSETTGELVSEVTVRQSSADVMTVTGEQAYSEGLQYTSNGNGTCYVSGIGTCTDTIVVIPSVSPDGDVVTVIGIEAFKGCTGLTGVVIPDSVTTIAKYAFYSCSGLTSVTIPGSVTGIGYYAFTGCNALTSVYITDLAAWCKITFGTANYGYDGSNPLQYAEELYLNGELTTDLVIPSGVTAIGTYAFRSCSVLKSVTIPGSVTSIGRYAFYDCPGLTAIYISDMAAWCQISFEDETANPLQYAEELYLNGALITDLVIPNGVHNIGNYAFYSFKSLTSVTIPGSVDRIGNYAFYGSTKLTGVAIQNGVTSIGNYAFYSCAVISDLTIPDTVTSIGNYAFAYCRGLTSTAIPDSVVSIGDYAFYYCYGLTSITIPNSVTGIGKYAFYYCYNAEELTIGNSVVSIGDYAFYNCIKVASITIPDSVSSIGHSAFGSCLSLTSMTLPFAGGTRDGSMGAFFGYIFGASVYSSNESVVPSSLKEVTITGGGGATHIFDYAFYLCSGLTNVRILDGVTSIGQGGFEYCYGLTGVTIPSSMESIGDAAFFDCTALSEVHITDLGAWSQISFEYSYANPLYYAKKLYLNGQTVTHAVIPEGVTHIGGYAFVNCEDLISVTIPGSVTGMSTQAFEGTALTEVHIIDLGAWFCIDFASFDANPLYYTDQLYLNGELVTNLVVPEGTTAIKDFALYGYSSLTDITIPNSVAGIGTQAFDRCSNLKKVVFESGSLLQSIDTQAFARTGIGINQGAITYLDSELAWRFIQKATDWDGGLTTWKTSFVFGEKDAILYEMSDDRSEFYVGEYVGTGATANIPELFCGRPLTQIYEKAFYNIQGLEEITVPNTIEHIFSSAFYNCPDLTIIVVNGSDVTLEHGIIFGCEALNSLTVPFMGRTAEDAEGAYLGYLFGAGSYKNNTIYVPMTLKTVILTSSIFIGDYAFKDCKYLEEIVLPDSVIQIGSYAFAGCEGMSGEWALPASLERVGDYAFAGCNSISLFVLPEGVTEIGSYAFANCISLRRMELPDSVTEIGTKILENCNNIKTIKIGGGIREIPDVREGYALFGIDKLSSSLTAYEIGEGNAKFASDERGVLYELHDSLAVPVAVLDAPAKADLKDYRLPEHIVYIGPYAFAYNTTLRWIQLDRVRRIDKCAFLEATSLVAAVFGSEDGVDSEALEYAQMYDAYIADKHREGETYSHMIGDQAFFGCTMLQYVNLWTDFIVSIGQEAFYDCNMLSSVQLSKSVQNIGHRAFGKTALESISVDGDNARYASFDGVLYEMLDDGSYKLLLFPACKTVTNAVGKVYQSTFRLPEQRVSMVESYAFQDAIYLKEIYLDPSVNMLVGDYAFQDSSLQKVHIGEKVTSLGLVRGEGEYTVFEGCESLASIEVSPENPYYSSEDGVLFDKEQTKLIKYPYHKVGGEYHLPDTVSIIASMAFKGNKNLNNVVISSYIHTVGLEAFYDCTNLASIYFDHVYAPVSVLENAFTTNTVAGSATQALLYYSGGYANNGSKGEYGWKNYKGIYLLHESNIIPSFQPNQDGNVFYAVVVVDSSGVPVAGATVSLSDPNGITEVITAVDGIAMFYDNTNAAVEGVFSLTFDGAYEVTVTDPSGKYYTFTNPALLLDEDMLITYITLTRLPTAYGVSCNGEDINSQRVELNKANIDFTDVLLDENGNIRYGADGQTPLFDESVEISVIGYCDSTYAFTDAEGNVLDNSCGLYQNGVKIASACRTEQKDGATIFYFRPAVAELANEVDLEVRLTAVPETGDKLSCSTVLNIHIFDFYVDADELQLDEVGANIDLSGAGDFLTSLMGADALELSFGEHVKLTTTVEGDTVNIALQGSKELLKKKKKLNNDYEQGFKENNKKGMETYRFQYTGVLKDDNYRISNLRYNITFTRETEDSGYYYYRCKVHNIGNGTRATDSNLIATYYGVVNALKISGTDDRSAAKLKADLIFGTHYAYVLSQSRDEDAVKAGASKARYSEPVVQLPDSSQKITNQKLEISITGQVSFQYVGDGQFRCTNGEIKGTLAYQFNHDQQLMVWVIPVTLRVEVKANGELSLTIEIDEEQEVDWEFLLTLELDITASIGVGCSVASVGFYGNVGTVFVLEILPEFGVDSWKIYGEMGAYARVLWFEHKYRFTPSSWADGYYIVAPKDSTGVAQAMPETAYMASLYLAESYTEAAPESLQTAYRPVVINGQLYKICYADVSGNEKYDAYNNVKLALSKWDGQDWSQPVIIDDNGLNDAEYVLYQSDGKLMMAYTQQTQKLSETNAGDTYAAADSLQIKVVELAEEPGTPVTVAKPNSYAYLTQYAIVDGVPTVVWAENADNNIFGVSPYNYIDNSGSSHVFATTANSIWTSQYVDGAWTAPVCMENGLSAVTQIAVNGAGQIAYIVDTNGDLTDTGDRVLHYGLLGEAAAFNDPANGSVKSVIADGNRFLYYYDAVSDEETDGWLSLPTVSETDSFPQDAPEEFVILYDENGGMLAILYSANKVWTDAGQKKTGSAIYGRFLENGVWGEAVELSAYRPEADRYVQKFAATVHGQTVLISAATLDAAGENPLHSSGSCQLGPKLSVEVSEVDYAGQQVIFTVKNQGSVSTDVYMSTDNGAYMLISQSALPSGASMQYAVSQPQAVRFAMSQSGDGAVAAENISLAYSDLQTNAKQVLLGTNDFLLFSVRNMGNTANTGITVIRNGAYDAAAVAGHAVYKAVMSLDLKPGQITQFLFVNENYEIETAWAVKHSVEPGAIKHYELALGELTGNAEQSVVSLYTIPLSQLEPETMLENNYTCINYEACEGVLQSGEAANTQAVLGSNAMEFAPSAGEALKIPFFCPEEDAVSAVRIGDTLLASDGYAVEKLSVGGIISIPSSVLADMQGSQTVYVEFTSGEVCKMTLKLLGRYTAVWIDGDRILQEQQLLEGTVPEITTEMVKSPDDAWIYTFAGWDCTGDGVADTVTAITGDVTYCAVWNMVPRSYRVQWSMLGSAGEEIIVTETYLYGDIPSYLGTVFVPDGSIFVGWKEGILPVTGDAVYTAAYENDQPTVIPTLTLDYPTLSFEDEILYNVYYTLDDATGIVEMGLITFATRDANGTMDTALDVIPGFVNSGSTYMVQSNGIPAKNLGDAVYFKVYAKLTDGSYVYSDVAGYHAVAYANTVLNSNAALKAKALVVAMLNYGAAAQEYFGYKTDSLMNADLTAEQQALVSAYDESMVQDVVKAESSKVGSFVMNGGYSNIFPTVSFEGAFAINFYFTPSKTVDAAPVMYYWDAKTYNAVDVLTPENATGVLTMAQDGSNWGAAVEGIAAKALDDTIYVAGFYTSNGVAYPTGVIAYSLGNYCKTVAANGTAFGAATAVYGYYAKAYFI